MSKTDYILTGECPPGVHVRYALGGDSVTVGRHGVVQLPDASVSREHAVFARRGDSWLLTDSGSRNGTFVNGVSVQRKVVNPGDIVKFGKIQLRVESLGDGDESDDLETSAMTIGSTASMCPAGPGAQALVGRSESLRTAMRLAARAAKSNATILLFGESGTGKELFARLVWEESQRSDKVFVPVHSGAIEPTLLASTLFGYEKGAFTGADKQKRGLFEDADGGTIFLDEIGEISQDTQVKLLRVLQEGEFMRVGGTKPVKVDVRVICATNRDLAAEVKAGRFREDLYYRLNVIEIDLPPLRERPGDIEDLVSHYVSLLGGPGRSVSPEAMAALSRYRWPGNVRELRNVVERMLVLSAGDRIEIGDLPQEMREEGRGMREEGSGKREEGAVPLAEIEMRHIEAVLESCGGNKKIAAERLGISRSTLYEKLKELEDARTESGHGLSETRTNSVGSRP